MKKFLLLLICILVFTQWCRQEFNSPNIVLIFADDLEWNDLHNWRTEVGAQMPVLK